MPSPLDGVDTSNEPYVIVSSDTHAGLQVEEYRDYLESKFHPQFDQWVVERHEHRRLVEEVNGEYVARWESENAEASGVRSTPRSATRSSTPTVSPAR